MNIIIFCLTILVIYGIIAKTIKAYKKLDIKQRMEDIEETEENYENVVKFKKAHKGNIEKKKQTIETFTKE